MVLGAGPNQLPLITKAVAQGLSVITVDYLPENVGHHISHQSVNCSTSDVEGVLRIAREHQIDGVLTLASDIAVPTLAIVAERLGLPGPGAEVGVITTNKARFREFQRSHGLDAPVSFSTSEAFEAFEPLLKQLPVPFVLKPADSSGSRGVRQLEGQDLDAIRDAFEEARRFSRSGQVCAEEYVEGTDVSGDGFLRDGVLRAVVTTKHKRGLVPIGHQVPSSLNREAERRVLAEVSRCCMALGYSDGPLDFDVRVSSIRSTVLELSPRLGGNSIPALISHATGVDLVEVAINWALGTSPELPEAFSVRHPCASLILGSEKEGLITGLAKPDEVRALVPEIFELSLSAGIGDLVRPFSHSGNGFGHVLFSCSREQDFSELSDRIRQALQLRTRTG